MLSLPLEPDNAPEILAWLCKYDARPRILPEWPASSRMALVFVSLMPANVLVGGVLLSPQEMADSVTATLTLAPRLYFSVPRLVLLSSNLVPGLSEESFCSPVT